MWLLIQLFVDIALHRRGPEAVPAAPVLLYVVAAVALGMGTISLLLLGQAPGLALLESVLHLVVFLGFYRLVLILYGYASRYRQTVTALLGTSVLLSVLGMPLLPLVARAAEQGEPLSGFSALVLLGLLLWSVDIGAFILSRALGQHYLLGVVIVIGFFVADSALRQLMMNVG
jgi:CDP-diglyceride synthetase